MTRSLDRQEPLRFTRVGAQARLEAAAQRNAVSIRMTRYRAERRKPNAKHA